MLFRLCLWGVPAYFLIAMSDRSMNADAEAMTSELRLNEPILIDADPEAGFNYPYYLTVPETVVENPGADTDASRRAPILVEPHNVGQQIDAFEQHLDLAEERLTSGFGRRIAEALGSPFLIPVFPRPFEDPVDWTHMIHMLDAETMQLEEGPLARVDLQLLSMIEDAQARLAAAGYRVPDEVMLNGFSSQAAFVNRFAALHPDWVRSVSAGGMNGLVILPKERAELRGFGERDLPYPVGVANLEALTGEPFDKEAFSGVYQFLYIGEHDDKDALLYPDAWTDPELRGVAILTYGEDIHEDRFPYCHSVYEESGVNAVFKMYDDTGHTPEPAESDVISFHKQALEGEPIASIRADLAGNVE